MKHLHIQHIRWTILILLFWGVWIFRWIPGAGEWYAQILYPYISTILSAVASVFPFSLCEITVVCFTVCLLVYPYRARKKGRCWIYICIHEIEIITWIFVWFYWGWGINYFRDDFFMRSGTTPASYDKSVFHSFITAYTDSLNTAYLLQDPLSKNEIHEKIKETYQKVPKKFGLTVPQKYQKPKYSLVNRLYSKVGVLGYMGPFFDESHVNHELFPSQYPFVYAHELSHLLGTSSEAEANFWAYQICIRSKNHFIEYCGYLGLFPYIATDARRILSNAEFKEWIQHIHPDIVQEIQKENRYWDMQYSQLIGSIQNRLYDWYLKNNRIPSGKKTYGEVVGMLLSLPEQWWK